MKYNIYHWSIPITFVVLHYLWSGLWQCCGIDLRPKIVWKSYIRLYSKTFSSNLILQVWNTMFSTWIFQTTSLSCITYEVVYDNAVGSTFVPRLWGSLIFVFIASNTFSSNPILQVLNMYEYSNQLVFLHCLWSGLCFALLLYYHFEIYIKYIQNLERWGKRAHGSQ